jgi:hypothetical protein
MHRKLVITLCVLAILAITTTTVFAARYRFKLTATEIGSFIAIGYVTGVGSEDLNLTVNAKGIPVTTCTNQGGNQAPGQNPPKLSASDTVFLSGDDPLRKNGRSPFETEAEEPLVLPGKQGGCPNNNWTATVDFVFWTEATLILTDPTNGKVLAKETYQCQTNRDLNTVQCE